jgi:phosphatidylglycerol lysyltransferase
MLAGLVALMGITNISSALLVHQIIRNRVLHTLLPIEVISAGRSLTMIAGFSLLIVAWGLMRGKRVAWMLTLGLLGASALLHMIKGLDWEEALGAIALGGVLLVQRRHFVCRSDPPTLRRAPLFLAGGVVAIVVYGLVGFWLLRAFQPVTLSLALQELAAQMLWSDGPYAPFVHGRAAWFLDSLSLLSLTLVSGTLLLLLRPVLPHSTSACDRARADALLRRYATSSLAPFARESDKLLYFGETVEGVVVYRVAGRGAVVCGDPIAAPEHVGKLAQEFMHFCARQDWLVCFYEVQPRHLPDYTPLGFEVVKIGEDAWIELSKFTLKGPAIADVRHAVSNIVRDGLTFHRFDPRQDSGVWAQVQAIESAWRAAQGGIELRFSIGRLPDQPDPNARYTLALAADGATVLAYCSFLPIEGIDGLAVDVMRRAPGAPNGTMEFLLARSLEYLRETGIAWVALGLAPLANVDTPRDSLLERGIRAIYSSPKINAAYHFQSLFFFKCKFNPQWRGGYLLYPNVLALPAVLAAVVRVHVPILGARLVLNALREKLVVRQTASTAVAAVKAR